jgi:hypothetical protein
MPESNIASKDSSINRRAGKDMTRASFTLIPKAVVSKPSWFFKNAPPGSKSSLSCETSNLK